MIIYILMPFYEVYCWNVKPCCGITVLTTRVIKEQQSGHLTLWDNGKLCKCNHALTGIILGQFRAFILSEVVYLSLIVFNHNKIKIDSSLLVHCGLTSDMESAHHSDDLPLHWRHNGHVGVSNHQPHGCLLNRLFRRRSKKTSKLRATGHCAGTSPGPVNSPHKGPVTRKMFPLNDVIMPRSFVRPRLPQFWYRFLFPCARSTVV